MLVHSSYVNLTTQILSADAGTVFTPKLFPCSLILNEKVEHRWSALAQNILRDDKKQLPSLKFIPGALSPMFKVRTIPRQITGFHCEVSVLPISGS